MNRNNEETTMTTQRSTDRFARGVEVALGIMFLLVLAAWCAIASAQGTRTATITFTRPSTYTDGSSLPASVVVSYSVYQGAKGSTTKTKVGTITTTTTSINTGLQPGETCWQVSAIANGVEGALSNEACKTFPFPAPDVVTITVT